MITFPGKGYPDPMLQLSAGGAATGLASGQDVWSSLPAALVCRSKESVGTFSFAWPSGSPPRQCFTLNYPPTFSANTMMMSIHWTGNNLPESRGTGRNSKISYDLDLIHFGRGTNSQEFESKLKSAQKANAK